ncbi:cytochrome P450 [Kribbella sp. NPDC055110]
METNRPAFPFPTRGGIDISPEFGELLSSDAPLLRITLPVGGEAWLACRYEDVRQVLRSDAFSRARAESESAPRMSKMVLPSTTLMGMDPPAHTRVRRALAPLLSQRRADRAREGIRRAADQLLSDFIDDGSSGDIVSITRRLPAISICHLLGIDGQDADSLAELATAVLTVTPTDNDERKKRGEQLEEAIRTILDASDIRVRTAAVSELQEDSSLSRDEVIQLVKSLFMGGIGAPMTLLSSSVLFLMSDPTLVETIARDNDYVPRAADELIRLVPTGVGGFTRLAIRNTQVGQTIVKRNEIVVPVTTAANRDPKVFRNPSAFDLTRTAPASIAFGAGRHYCPGAKITRVEVQEFLRAMVKRAPNLHLSNRARAIEWQDGTMVRRLSRLEVEWD